MPDNLDETTSLTTETPPGSSAATPQVPSTQETVDWKKRAQGYQSAMQSALNERTKLEQANAEMAATLQNLNGQYTTLQTTHATASRELTEAKQGLERLRTITAEFPDLLSFITPEADLLPTAPTLEDLRAKLNAFRTVQKSKAPESPQAPKSPTPEGGTPPGGGPPPSGESSMEDLRAKMKKALIDDNRAEYDRLYGLYIKMPAQ